MFFFLSGFLKIVSIKQFSSLVLEYRVLPKRISIIVGYIVPFLEVAFAFLILFSKTFIFGVLGIQCLLLSFGYAILNVIKNKRIIACGCYGKFLDAKADNFSLLKILLISLINVFVLVVPKSVNFGIEQYIAGFSLIFFLIIIQKLWSYHKSTVDLLKKHDAL
nr:MauE/DoxX family redox-associated membrane protein [Lentibacillus populi]